MEDKYFYRKSTVAYASGEYLIERYNQFYQGRVIDDGDRNKYIYFSCNKLKTEKYEFPATDKLWLVRSFSKAEFLKTYNVALKEIHDVIPDEGEFYIINSTTSFYEVAYFSKNDKTRQAIKIGFGDSVSSFYLSIKAFPCKGYRERLKFRKKGVMLTRDKFLQLLNCTFQFLADSDSYMVLIHDYIRKFHQIIDESGNVEGFIISPEKSQGYILKQLQTRKENLERRLIENDTDAASDRASIRGEIEGIKYAINTIQSNNSC